MRRVRNTVPCPNSCGAVPLKKLATKPRHSKVTTNAHQISYTHNVIVTIARNRNNDKWPSACTQPCMSVRFDNSRKRPGSIGLRYQRGLSVLRTSASGGKASDTAAVTMLLRKTDPLITIAGFVVFLQRLEMY